MNILLFYVGLLAALSAYADNWNCAVHPTPWFNGCKVDLTVAIDMSTAMGTLENVDTLLESLEDYFLAFPYGSDNVVSLITFGAGGYSSSDYVNSFESLCQLVVAESNKSHTNGLYDASLRTVFETYKVNQPVDTPNYQRVIVVFTAMDQEAYDAWPIAQSLQDDYNVQIITVTLDTSDPYTFMNIFANQWFVCQECFNIGNLTTAIANATCANSGVTYQTSPPTPFPSPYANGGDGLLCAANPKNAWLDLVFVIEHSSASFFKWSSIVSSVMNTITQLTLSNTLASGHTSRIAIITYDSSDTTKLQFSFTSEQSSRNILIALNKAKPLPTLDEYANIAAGLDAAGLYLTSNSSFRAQGVMLYVASGYDTLVNNPSSSADRLKARSTKIATVIYDELDGDYSIYIRTLASPGLYLNATSTNEQFGWAVSQLNCRCAQNWTQLVVNDKSYAECLFYNSTEVLQAFATCSNPDTDILVVINTPARFDFILNIFADIGDVSLGLSRNNSYSPWTWDNMYPYTGYPFFNAELTDNDVYAYESLDNSWFLFADDGMTTPRSYICQRPSGDTDNIIDLT